MSTILHFGKYSGYNIEDVPSDYLKWMSENFDDDSLVEEADKELEFRDTWNKHFYSGE